MPAKRSVEGRDALTGCCVVVNITLDGPDRICGTIIAAMKALQEPRPDQHLRWEL